MEKIRLLLYCTKSKPTLYNVLGKYIVSKYMGKDFMQNGKTHPELNGYIVAECDFEVEEITYATNSYEWYFWGKNTLEEKILNKSCLTREELDNYLEGNNGYAIHIKNLNIFDEPRELNEYYNSKDYCKTWQPIIKAPQNMMYADYINIEKNIFRPYILISIRPEWLCKILNGEKTIEVRRKVLKEMINNA